MAVQREEVPFLTVLANKKLSDNCWQCPITTEALGQIWDRIPRERNQGLPSCRGYDADHQIFSAHWINLVNPSYELWELAARYELEYVEKFSRMAARSKADSIFKGEGLAYFMNRGIPIYMVDRMIRALFAAREAVIQTDYKGSKIPYLWKIRWLFEIAI